MNSLHSLQRRADALITWKEQQQNQQVNFPIDSRSKKEIERGVLVQSKRDIADQPVIATDLLGLGLGIQINETEWFVKASFVLYPFTVDASTDIFTYTNGNHELTTSSPLALASTGTLPSYLSGIDIHELSTASIYYPVDITQSTFKLATEENGTALDIVLGGSGSHYFGKL